MRARNTTATRESRPSEQRFFGETGWPRDMAGELILEVGSGSGRFNEQAARTGATVVSLDYSYAVDANNASNGARNNVLIVQADVFAMPFRPRSFDRVFCFGMLQHTPRVPRARSPHCRRYWKLAARCARIFTRYRFGAPLRKPSIGYAHSPAG